MMVSRPAIAFSAALALTIALLQFGRAHCRASCWAISVRYTWSAIPIPPDLANDFAYSSVRIERQTPVAPLPPKGPSPSMPSEHVLEHRVEEHGFEILRRRARLCFLAGTRRLGGEHAVCERVEWLETEAQAL
jgi:hypothetical protein